MMRTLSSYKATDYDAESDCFNTESVDAVVKDALSMNEDAIVVIKINCASWAH